MVRSYLYVIIQFACLLTIPFAGNLLSLNYIYVGLVCLGIFIGLWAVISMLQSRLSIFPDVKQGSKLIIRGPYIVIRHPMYSAIIITYSSILIFQYNLVRLILSCVLFMILFLKIKYEEGRLHDYFGNEYDDYCTKTWKVIPFLY